MDLKFLKSDKKHAANKPKGGSQISSTCFELRDLIDEVKKHFSNFSRSHGALTERAILFGPAGVGKRRIAEQAGREVTESDGRRLVVVECGTFEIFVRDYYNVYHLLTGERLPAGLTVPLALSKIKHTLEQRRLEWLLLLMDMGAFMDEDSTSHGGQKMNLYLPERGHLIVTSREAVSGPISDRKATHSLDVCPLEVSKAAGALCIRVNMLSPDQPQCTAYVQDLCPALLRVNGFRLFDLQGSPAASLTYYNIVAANLVLLNISFRTYIEICEKMNPQSAKQSRPVALKSGFYTAMRILWDALADRDAWTLKVLAAVVVAEPAGTPLRAIKRLPIFSKTIGERLTPALDLLKALRIVEVKTDMMGIEVITIKNQIFDWVRRRVRQTYSDKEFRSLVHSWIDVLSEDLENEPDRRAKTHKWWDLQPVIWSVINAAAPRTVATLKMLKFLVSVSELINDDFRLANYAGIFIDEAHKIWVMTLNKPEYSSDVELWFIRIKGVRTRAHLFVGNTQLAQQDLGHAKMALQRIKTSGGTVDLDLQRRVDELEVRVSMARGLYADSERLLDKMLDEPGPNTSEETVARWHSFMAVALNNQRLDVAALQHSHAALQYWVKQDKDVKQGKIDITMVGWLDKHAKILVELQKFRGALLFLPKLFDIWSELATAGSMVLWRLANSLVLCYANIDKVVEAEKIAIRILEFSPIQEAHGDALYFGLHMLQELGVLYLNHGRNVEAEGVFRFILRCMKTREVRRLLDGNGGKVIADWWAQLVVALVRQDRYDEARAVRDEYQDPRSDEPPTDKIYHNEAFMNKFLSEGQKRLDLSKEVYQRGIWAEEDGMHREWKMLLRETDDVKERSAYRRAVKQFGSVARRVRERNLVEIDVDIHLVSKARKSKLLHLLDRNLIHMAFDSKKEPGEGEPAEEVWLLPKQHLVDEYINFHEQDCTIFRRRTASINPVEMIEKRFTRIADYQETKPKELQQMEIDDYFFTIVEHPPHLDCQELCPCRDASLRGEAEFAELEYHLWDIDDSLRSNGSGGGSSARYPTSQTLVPTSALLPDEVFIRDDEKGYWRWMQSELALGEGPDENYIVPHSLDIPILTITPADGEEELTKVKNEEEVQPKITKYFSKQVVAAIPQGNTTEQEHQPHRLQDIVEDTEAEVSEMIEVKESLQQVGAGKQHDESMIVLQAASEKMTDEICIR